MKQKQIIALVSATHWLQLRWQAAAKHQKKTHRQQQ